MQGAQFFVPLEYSGVYNYQKSGRYLMMLSSEVFFWFPFYVLRTKRFVVFPCFVFALVTFFAFHQLLL
ncbi:hypothetical protein HOY80DRAFT_968105 [Tuber brumale]|nr:hypothetical protein HOY80DRAFT_968105 [Tuber brumale]